VLASEGRGVVQFLSMPLPSFTTASALGAPAFSPLYAQIKSLLLHSLQAGEWGPGQAIPSEQELAQRYGVSQGTVRKAVDELAADGRVLRRQGKGTFVATHREEQARYRFLRLFPDAPAGNAAAVQGADAAGSVPPAPAVAPPLQRRQLGCKRLRAPAAVARALGLKAGEPALQVQRLLLDAAQPVVLDELWLPLPLFKGLTDERLAAHRGTLYGLFEAEFGVHMLRASEQLRAVAANAAQAELLGLGPGTPLLEVQRVSYTYGDKPVEWRRGLYHTAMHHYRNELG
jgi:GntR family transcriptional regulator